jgi:ACT domain-containing protein
VATETKVIFAYVDARGRMRVRIDIVDTDDLKRVLDLLDEICK